MIVLGFLLFVATGAKLNNIFNKVGFIHHRNLSHHTRRLEDYDPGICADVYKAAVECQNNAVS
jgi:hypothetical protein